MKDTIVASRYAKSLLELTLEQGNLERAKSDMELILKTSAENRDLNVFIKNPIIKSDIKYKILDQVFSGNLSDLTLAFIKLITKKKREIYLFAIAKEFLRQYNLHKQIITAVITTARGIDDTTKNRVLQMVTDSTKNEVELVEKVDPELIGGFILEFGDKRVDTSISHKLNRLKREFKENPYIKNF